MGDFIWEEIKYISKNPLKICGYAPYLMIMIEKVTKTKYGTDARHERLRPSVPKQRVMPSPHRYSENEDEMETEEGGADQQTSQQPAGAQVGTGLTGLT